MYYLRARYYIPRTGRFLTADKYEGDEVGACDCSNRNRSASLIGTHHLFAYANGDPIDEIDPTGLDAWITYRQLRVIIRGLTLEAHHLLEQRFAMILVAAGCVLDLAASIPLSKEDHQVITNAWRQRFPYGKACATAEAVLAFALEVYKDRPELIQWLTGQF